MPGKLFLKCLCSWQQVIQRRGAKLHAWLNKVAPSPTEQRLLLPRAQGETPGDDEKELVGEDDVQQAGKEERASSNREREAQQRQRAEEMERQRLLASEPLPSSRRGFLDNPKFALRSLVRSGAFTASWKSPSPW